MSWDPKDYIAVGAAVISCFSLGISYVTFRQKNDENRRAKRKEFRDAIIKCDDLISLSAALDSQVKNEGLNNDHLGTRMKYIDQKVFYLKHAASIVTENENIAEEYELLRMGVGFQTIGWEREAEHFFRLSIQRASNEFTKAVSMRSLARFFYRFYRIDEGIEMFEKCLATIPKNDKEEGFVIETYRMWALAEHQFNDKVEAKRLIEKSAAALNSSKKKRSDMALHESVAMAQSQINFR